MASRSAVRSCVPATPSWRAAHQAKVYGRPPLGAPPMSVPHLDTRVDQPQVLRCCSGRSPGWSPKFLKQGKVTDLPLSVKPNNLASMLGVGLTETGLLKYLIGQLLLSEAARVETLREFAPSAQSIPIGSWTSPVSGSRSSGARAPVACSSSAPPCSPPVTAASPVCWAPRRGPPRLCPPCWK